jgi:hypothetical protein
MDVNPTAHTILTGHITLVDELFYGGCHGLSPLTSLLKGLLLVKYNTINISIIIAGVLFLCWYLPVAYFNVYACDDYWFGANVSNHGFWGYQLYHWLHWEGSYTHTFLASLPHAIQSSYMPFVGNIFSILLLFFSLVFFLRTYTRLSHRENLVCSLYLLAFLFICTKGEAEIRFWICANITYVSEMSFLLFFYSLYHNIKKEPSYIQWGGMFLLTFIIGGSKLDFILYAFSGLIIYNVLLRKSVDKYFLTVIILLGLFATLNIIAPGNYIRLEAETQSKVMEENMSFIDSMSYRFSEFVPFVLCTICLLPIATRLECNDELSRKRLVITIVVLCMTFVLDGFIMYICFKDSGPLRSYFVPEVYFAILITLVMNHMYKKSLFTFSYMKVVCIFLAMLLSASNIPMMKQISGSVKYSKLSKERDKYLTTYEGRDILEIKALPQSYLLLSYFANDKIWIENVYIPYFHKKIKEVVICQSQDKH